MGSNKKDYHLINVNFKRDYNGEVLDLKTASSNDLCSMCGKQLKSERGIEVGQLFKLGTKYSQSMNATFVNENGQNIPMVMGCYGIGVSRTLASIIEQYHDEDGIVWPEVVAPFKVVIVPVNYKDEAQKELANIIYDFLKYENIEVVIDDRDAKPGFKFKDWDLIGIPTMIIVGKKAVDGIIEIKDRKTKKKNEVDHVDYFAKILNK